MAKQSLFKVRNLSHRKPSNLPSPPAKISSYRLRAGEWKVAKTKTAAKASPSRRRAKRARAVSTCPRSAGAILKCESPEWQCFHCGRTADDEACGIKCYRAFRRKLLKDTAIHILGPGLLGYSAHLAVNAARITAETILGEYIGELLPLTSPATSKSLYRLEIPGVCAVDSGNAGNWTRFVNSSCAPNVRMCGESVGKRHVILLQALRDIQPGEELAFQYGMAYFKSAGFKCRCSAVDGEHWPGEKSEKKESSKRRRDVK